MAFFKVDRVTLYSFCSIRLQGLNNTDETKKMQPEKVANQPGKTKVDSKGEQIKHKQTKGTDLDQKVQMDLKLLDDLPFQPVPIHSAPDEVNGMLRSIEGCPNYRKLYDQLANETFFKNVSERYKEFYGLVSNLTAWQVDDLHYFAQLQSIFYVYKEANPSYLPDWHLLVDPDDLEYLAALHYSRISFNPELAKLSTGIFFSELLQHFDQVISPNDYNRKLYLIFGHEENLAAILNSMGVFEYRVPKFASAIIWELYEAEGRNYVQVSYRESDDYTKNLTLAGCDTRCDYDWFRNKLEPILMAQRDRKNACDIKED
ncbi:unnamed protein product [Acanthoscelides obtectus]|uniref:acid phosphatase n=1 Tax=Acanthoscelides obtectus TaxID=200917 RepID=A0A9P0PF71_ACAOB|nr:unnamed protein product [Acanthoscelides obtectus]CAK1659094.1 Prostatic acid phosphatase [Acanthoscelides obtectus]